MWNIVLLVLLCPCLFVSKSTPMDSQPFDPHADLKDLTFRQYRPAGLWHEGTCHVVHKAINLATSSNVAIKFYSDTTLYKTEKEMLSIVRESRNATNVIKVFDFAEDDSICPGYNYMVMEYCKFDLEHYVDRHKNNHEPLDIQYFKYIVKSIVQGIQACHEMGVVHCDIKSKNVMLFNDDENSAEGVWKLVDFDSARRVGQDRLPLLARSAVPENTVPEVAAKHLHKQTAKASPEMDLFALGMLLYYMNTGQTYWTTNVTGNQMLQMLASSDELVISNSSVQSQEEQDIIKGLIQKEPSKRTSLQQLKTRLTVTNPDIHKALDNLGNKLGNKLDTIQRDQVELNRKITTVGKFIESQEQRTGKQMADMLNELHETKRLILSADEASVPRVFIIEPENKDWSNPKTWITRPFRLHLLCEEGFHKTAHEGYLILKADEFIKKYGVYLKFGIWMLLFGAKIASHGLLPTDGLTKILANTLDEAQVQFMDQAQSLSDAINEYVDKKVYDDEQSWEGHDSGDSYISSYRVLRGQALKNFEVFLKNADPSLLYGNLDHGRHRETNNLVWVCANHYDVLNPLSCREPTSFDSNRPHMARKAGSTLSSRSSSSTASRSTQRLRDRIANLKEKADKHAANIEDMSAHEHLNRGVCRKVDKRVRSAQETLQIMLAGLDDELEEDRSDADRLAQLQDIRETLIGYTAILEELELFVKNARGTGGLLKRWIAAGKGDNFDRLCDILEEKHKTFLQMDDLSRVSASKQVPQLGAAAIKQLTGLRSEVVQFWDEVATQGLTKEQLEKFRLSASDLKECQNPVTRKGTKFQVVLRLRFGLEVAVKLLGSLAHNNALADRLRKEVAVYSYMKPCAHIVEFIGVCEEKDSFNIVMEWATWGDLHTFMLENERWKKITEQEKLRMAVEAAQGLEFLHASKVLHKDIRSHNILLTQYSRIEYKVKITNFGRSRKFDQHTQRVSSEAIERLRWSAPERLAEEVNPYTPECDVYSLGMLFWEITQGNGSLPFADVSDNDVVDHILLGKTRESFNPSPVFKELNIIIQEAWQRKPNFRPTARELSTHLDTTAVRPVQPQFFDENVQSKNVHIDMMPMSIDQSERDMDQLNLTETRVESIVQGIDYHREQQYPRAFKVFMAHATEPENDAEAQYWVGYHYWFGHCEGGPNYGEALKWLKKSADGSNAQGQYLYGSAYWNGTGTQCDKEEGFKWFYKAAKSGDKSAQYIVGCKFYKGDSGLGIQRNKDLGEHYIIMSARQGHKDARATCAKLKIQWGN